MSFLKQWHERISWMKKRDAKHNILLSDTLKWIDIDMLTLLNNITMKIHNMYTKCYVWRMAFASI